MKIRLGCHKPNKILLYRTIHYNALEQLCNSYFVGNHNLTFESFPGMWFLSGEVSCLGNILVTVQKTLVILDEKFNEVDVYIHGDLNEGLQNDYFIQTVEYSYNASIQGYSNICRYDNQDDFHLRSSENHFDEHHKHEFDWRTGIQKQGSPFWVGDKDVPTLGDFLWSLHDWYYENRDFIPCPNSYAVLGQGRYSV